MITAKISSLLKKSMKSESGFTLIEIMIVVAIIALLAALIGPNLTGSLQEGRVSSAKVEIRQIQTALLQYNMRHGRYPSTDEGLQVLIQEKLIQGSRNALNDPWGNPYQYRYPGQYDQDEPEMWSYGSDGREGGEGHNAEIRSWEL